MMFETLHYLVLPNGITGMAPGSPIYFHRGAEAVAVTYAGSDGAAYAMLPAGELRMTLGDARNAPAVDIEMQARDCMLHPEGRVSRVTPFWARLLEIREMGHKERCALEEWRRLTG